MHPGIDNHVSFGTVLNVIYDAGLMQSYMDVEDLAWTSKTWKAAC